MSREHAFLDTGLHLHHTTDAQAALRRPRGGTCTMFQENLVLRPSRDPNMQKSRHILSRQMSTQARWLLMWCHRWICTLIFIRNFSPALGKLQGRAYYVLLGAMTLESRKAVSGPLPHILLVWRISAHDASVLLLCVAVTTGTGFPLFMFIQYLRTVEPLASSLLLCDHVATASY